MKIMKHLKIKTKSNQVYKYSTLEELSKGILELSPNIKMIYYRGDLFWHKLASQKDIKKYNLVNVNCWDCKHAIIKTVTFYEYGEDSTPDECGENYEVSETCKMGLKTGTCIKCEHFKNYIKEQ